MRTFKSQRFHELKPWLNISTLVSNPRPNPAEREHEIVMNPPDQPQPPQALCAAASIAAATEIMAMNYPPGDAITNVAAIITKHFPAVTQDTSRAGGLADALKHRHRKAANPTDDYNVDIDRKAADLLRALSADNARLKTSAKNDGITLDSLRRQLAEPPPDVQEWVINKLDLVSRTALTAAESENARIKKELIEANENKDDWMGKHYAIQNENVRLREDSAKMLEIARFIRRYNWDAGQDVRDEVTEILKRGHSPDCDFVNDNIEGIQKPCNCKAARATSPASGGMS